MANFEYSETEQVPVATVLKITKLPGLHTTYDIEVANRHRFYADGFLVHNCIGKYHAHGDSSVSGAITTLVQHITPTLLGAGNWGGLLDNAAAMRYTNCKLSAYGESFFNPDYINKDVTSFVPNYDGEDVEPVNLPSMLPNVLLNGGEGIGVGVTTKLPTFTPESVITVLKLMLSGESLTPKDVAKALVFTTKYGGHVLRTKDNAKSYYEMFVKSSATVQFTADFVIDRDNKALEINDWPPGLNPITFIQKVRSISETDQAFNHKGDTGFRIEMKKDHNYTQFDQYVAKIKKLAICRQAFKINVTYRTAKTVDGKTTFTTRFLSVSIPKLLGLWLRERLLTEKRSLEYRLKKQATAIAYSKLLIYASTKVDVIVQALKSKEPSLQLVKLLKITKEQAEMILELKVRQLSRLDKEAMEAKLKEQEALNKKLNHWYKHPKEKVSQDLDTVMLAIEKDRKYENVKGESLQVT